MEKPKLPPLPQKRVKLSLIETIPYKEVEKHIKVKDPDEETHYKRVIAVAMVAIFLDQIWDKYGDLFRNHGRINIEVEYIGITEDKKDFSYGVELIYHTGVYPPNYPQPVEERDVTLDEEIKEILKTNKLQYVEEPTKTR